MSESKGVEVAKYKITGLVDKFDEQMIITGQLPIGSVQELPVEYGNKCVEAGTAELVPETAEEVEEEVEEVEDEEEEDGGPTGGSGEEEVE